MAKRGAPIAGVAPLPGDGFLRETVNPLTLDERVALRSFLGSDLWKKVWRNAQVSAPGPMTGNLNSELGSKIANNRLHEMRGWEMLRAAIAVQIQDPVVKKVAVPENYPEGLEIVKLPPEKK